MRATKARHNYRFGMRHHETQWLPPSNRSPWFGHAALSVDIRHLRYFIAVVDSGSLTEAAKRLFVAQPAISQRMSDLEGELGVQLLIRGRLGVSPTAAGLALYQRARLVLKHIEMARLDVLETVGGAAGPFNIGLLRSVAPSIAAPLFSAIRQELPGLTPNLRVGYSDELARLVRTGELDIAMQVLPNERAKDLPALDALRERVYLVGHQDAIPSSGPLRLVDFARLPLLLLPQQPGHQRLLELTRRAGIELTLLGGIEDSEAIVEICIAQKAATILPELVARRALSRAALRAALIDEPALQRHLGFVTNPDIPRTATSLHIERLMAVHVRRAINAPEIDIK